jgi:ribose transport system permease protein
MALRLDEKPATLTDQARHWFREAGRRAGIAVGLAILIVVFTLLSPGFLSFGNFTNIALQAAINAIVAIGMTFTIVTAGIDLSVGSTVALTSVIAADLMVTGVPIPIAIVGALLVGAACGAINGLFIVKARLAPFIVTLGTLSIYRGAALLYTEGQPVYGVPAAFTAFLSGSFLGLPVPVLLAAAVAVVAHVALRHTRLGEHTLAIGGNEEASRLSGVPVGYTRFMAYVISGGLAALAAVVLVARLGAAEPISGAGYELSAIAAAVMGGASLSGGRGSIIGTVMGALIIATLQVGLTLLNVQAFYQLMAIGIVTILAVMADRTEGARGA